MLITLTLVPEGKLVSQVYGQSDIRSVRHPVSQISGQPDIRSARHPVSQIFFPLLPVKLNIIIRIKARKAVDAPK